MTKLLLLVLFFISPSWGDEKNLWKKPVMIGASLSDGFHMREMGIPFASPISRSLALHLHLKNELSVDHGKIQNFASRWTFLATEANGRYQIKRARAAEPTVVFAVDYLFWYLSANPRFRGPDLEKLTRLEFFEKGLAHLATLKCPVLVGNIPDAETSIGKALSKDQYPGAEIIMKANTRLAEWVKEHPQMIFLDLAKFHRLASSDLEVTVKGVTTPAGESRDLFLQWDKLHPTPKGAEVITQVALEALMKEMGK